MKKISIVIALCFLFCSAVSAFAAVGDHTRAAVVDDLKGTVTATQNETEMPAFRGLALLRGDRLAAGAESWSRLELNEGQFAVIEENTDIQIMALVDELTDARTTRVYMSGGKVWFDVLEGLSDGESFEVNTPSCALSVRGTFFSVTAAENDTTLTVYDGEVALSYGGDGDEITIVVGAGNKASVAFETGTVPAVTQSDLTTDDMVPLQIGEEEGPGGVYEVLRDQVQENEEFMRHIEQINQHIIEQSIEPPAEPQVDQPVEQPAEQPGAEGPMDGLENMSHEEMMRVIDLLQGGSAFPETLLVINEPHMPTPDPYNADIKGRLQAGTGNDGTYGFNVNLGSGEITGGTMNGGYGDFMTYDLHGGTGHVSGNDFSVSGFQGSVTDVGFPSPFTDVQAALDGTARNGFDNLGDIGASGTFEIIYGDGSTTYGVNGTIVDGWRVN